MAVVRINEFTAAAGQAEALRAFLASVIALIEGAHGCEAVELLVAQEDPSQLVVLETWESVAAHKAAAARVPPEKIAEVMPLLGGPIKGRYYDATK